MSPQSPARELLRDSSDASIWVYSVIAGILALAAAVFIQWLVYDDWLHEPGPLRLAGCILAGFFLGALVFRSLWHVRQKRRQMLQLLHTIRRANDRIRNSLQSIECVTYAAAPETTEEVKNAVDAIECILKDLLLSPGPQGATPTKWSAAHEDDCASAVRERVR
jgi:hypothetical protein